MNYIKSHIILILSLVSILVSIYLFKSFNFLLNQYKQNILEDYSIVVVSKEKISSLDLSIISKIEPIDISKQLKKLKSNFTNLNLQNIKLPYFYKIKLKRIPTPIELKTIEESLKTFPFIKRVITYKSTQQKIYDLLLIISLITKSFMIITFILGIMLIIKQQEVWKLEHQETIYIMELFGAPFWFRGAPLFKMSIFDSVTAIILTFITINIINSLDSFKSILNDLNMTLSDLNIMNEIFLLSILSLAITLISSTIVIIGKNK